MLMGEWEAAALQTTRGTQAYAGTIDQWGWMIDELKLSVREQLHTNTCIRKHRHI